MKILTLHFFLLITIITCAQRTSSFPSPKGFINDYEGDFTPDQIKNLDHEVKELLVKSMDIDSLKGIQMAVVTVTDQMFGDEKEMSSYVERLGDKWGLSGKGTNRAIIIAYGKKIRKVSIITGEGLDVVLPPSVCHRIIDEKMTVEFRKGDYYKAIMVAIKAIKNYMGLQ